MYYSPHIWIRSQSLRKFDHTMYAYMWTYNNIIAWLSKKHKKNSSFLPIKVNVRKLISDVWDPSTLFLFQCLIIHFLDKYLNVFIKENDEILVEKLYRKNVIIVKFIFFFPLNFKILFLLHFFNLMKHFLPFFLQVYSITQSNFSKVN